MTEPAHHIAAPSSRARHIQCTQSITLEAQFPETEETEEQREGTAAHWAVSEIDKRTVLVTMQALDAEVRRLGLGRVEPMPWLTDPAVPWEFDRLISKNPIGGYHHMGTTRMSAEPTRGVTDGNARVHGLANLYVAGSSLFPTSGWANPTLTILALAFRLADHLAARRG